MSEFELFEALLWEPSRGYFLLERHLARLTASAHHFGFAADVEAIRNALADHARTSTDAHKVRLRLSADGQPTLEVAELRPSTPVRAALAAAPVDSANPWLRHKTSRRELYAAALASRPDVDDVILWNDRDELTETCTANLVLHIDGELLTPHADAGLLPGTYRAELLADRTIREARLVKQDLQRASAIELVNSVRRRCPIVLVG